MNCEQAKKVDFVEYLESLNHFPKGKTRAGEYEYLSPLREEKTASFMVNRETGFFYDFGDGNGGTIIDFGIQFHKCSISDFLQILEVFNRSGKPRQIIRTEHSPPLATQKKKKIIVLNTKSITSKALLEYIHERRVSESLIKQFCVEVEYQLYDNIYYAIGFAADAGGYELRNKYSKLSSKPKGYTFIDHGFKTVAVFEGFFSFLSMLDIVGHWEQLEMNFFILNSLSFLNKAKQRMEQHDAIILYLDRDTQGMKRTEELIKENKKYKDGSLPYNGYKDWNKYLIHIRKS